MARLTPKGTLALTAERKPLLDALELAAGATARASAVPALAAVRISAEGGRLVAAGTDSDLWIEAECPARVEGDGVAMAIEASRAGADGTGELGVSPSRSSRGGMRSLSSSVAPSRIDLA